MLAMTRVRSAATCLPRALANACARSAGTGTSHMMSSASVAAAAAAAPEEGGHKLNMRAQCPAWLRRSSSSSAAGSAASVMLPTSCGEGR